MRLVAVLLAVALSGCLAGDPGIPREFHDAIPDPPSTSSDFMVTNNFSAPFQFMCMVNDSPRILRYFGDDFSIAPGQTRGFNLTTAGFGTGTHYGPRFAWQGSCALCYDRCSDPQSVLALNMGEWSMDVFRDRLERPGCQEDRFQLWLCPARIIINQSGRPSVLLDDPNWPILPRSTTSEPPPYCDAQSMNASEAAFLTQWRPPESLPPGNSLYLNSSVGEPLGNGSTSVFVPGPFTFDVIRRTTGNLEFLVRNDTVRWEGTFETGCPPTVGYYPDLHGHARELHSGFHIRAASHCDEASIQSAVVIDAIQIQDQLLTRLDLRFEQRCGKYPLLRGSLLWSKQ